MAGSKALVSVSDSGQWIPAVDAARSVAGLSTDGNFSIDRADGNFSMDRADGNFSMDRTDGNFSMDLTA